MLVARALAVLTAMVATNFGDSPRLFGVLYRWDAAWYLSVAQHGYPSDPIPGVPDSTSGYAPWAFFPLLPIVIRGFAAAGLTYGAAAIIVIVIGNMAFALLSWRWLALVFDVPTAMVGNVLLAVFPGVTIMLFGYSELLFFPLGVGTLVALRRERWGLAAACALLAGLTRPTALVLVIAVAIAAVQAVRSGQRSRATLLAPVAAAVGPLAFLIYGWAATGDPLVWRKAEALWGQELDFGSSAARQFVAAVKLGWPVAPANVAALFPLVMAPLAVLGVAGLIHSRKYFCLHELVYAAIVLAIALAYSNVGVRPRMLMAAFPLVVGCAPVVATWPRASRRLLYALFAALSCGVTWIYLQPWPVVP